MNEMATQQGEYLPEGGHGHDPADSAAHLSSEVPPPPDGTAEAGTSSVTVGGRKKRAYAGQAYDFGTGANSALGGQQQGGGVYEGGFSQQAHEAGYPQGGYQQSAAAPAQSPGIGYQPGTGVGGYQPPAPSYPTQGPGIGQMTQHFGQMDMSQKPSAVNGPPSRVALNQLYPTDLLTQPFNVAELDYPPPPAVLPPNVSLENFNMSK